MNQYYFLIFFNFLSISNVSVFAGLTCLKWLHFDFITSTIWCGTHNRARLQFKGLFTWSWRTPVR